jgi:uncharacterized protein YcfJ
MKKTLVFSVLAIAAAGAFAQSNQQQYGQQNNAPEMGRVVSATPMVQQVAVPQQVCGTQQVITQAPPSGAGAVLGAIAGGVVGNAIGHGGGRAAATALGVVGGAALGNSAEGPGPAYAQNVQNCYTQNSYENRTVGYNVTYEYAGRQYTTQMANDPGKFVPVQVGAASDGYDQAPPQGYAPQGVVQSGVVVPQGYSAPPVVYAPPVYAAPYPGYYAPGYVAPIGVSIGLGYRGGYGHGHWR